VLEVKRHLMVIGDGPFSGTGFGEELRHVFYRTAQQADFEINWLSLQHVGYPIDVPDTCFPDIPHKKPPTTVKLYGRYGDPYHFGADVFLKHYRDINPEMVLFMGDPKNIRFYLEYKTRLGFPFIFYVTLDGLPIHPYWSQYLKHINLLIAMTDWAQGEYRKIGFSPAMIHHGIATKWWKVNPEEKMVLRRQYNIQDDVTVFVNWDVPQHRKRTDALLRCWRDFLKVNKNPKALLMLYADWKLGDSLGYDVEGLIQQYKVPRNTIIGPIELQGAPKYWGCAERPERLKSIVQMGDIYPSTTGGEGFGKCGLEAMAMGIPVIITDYAASHEVHQKGSMLIPTYRGRQGRFRMDDRRRSVETGIVNEKKFVDAMTYLYENEGERVKLSREAIKWAGKFDYYKVFVPQWRALLEGLNTDLITAKELLQI